MTDITRLVKNVELDRDGRAVIIMLHCSDELAAVVLFEDVAQKITSEKGLQLQLRGLIAAGGEGA